MYKPREHRRKTENDVVKECKGCGKKKAHRWIADSRKRKGGCPAAVCRECRAAKDRARRQLTSVKKADHSKVCKDCGEKKPHQWISDSRREKGGYYRHVCRTCHNERIRFRYETLKLAAIEYKGGHCSNCGFDSDCPAVYHFHHRDFRKKNFNISDICKTKSLRTLDAIKPELDKCDLLCSNCHAIIEHKTRIKLRDRMS